MFLATLSKITVEISDVALVNLSALGSEERLKRM
jgi:hypothetical protein